MAKPKPEIPPAYAVQVREARARVGLTQRQFGKLVGCNQPTVANIESGRHTPSDALLALMRKILGIDDNRGVDFLTERQKYLATRPNKRISVMVTDTQRWPLRKVRASVASVVAGNTKTFEELLALGGDESALDDILDELCAHTEEFLASVAHLSGWSRADLSVQAKDLVAHSRAVALTPANEQPPSEPIWVPVSGECEPPLVDEVWEGPVYTPYQPKEVPAPTESGVQGRRIRAVVMSTENSVTFDLCYRRKLEKMGVEIGRVVNPRRDIQVEVGKYDMAIVLTSRLGHARFDLVQGIAERAGLRLVFLDSKSSSWPVAFGMV